MQVGDNVSLGGLSGVVTAIDDSTAPPMAQVAWSITLTGWVPQAALGAQGDAGRPGSPSGLPATPGVHPQSPTRPGLPGKPGPK